MSNRINIKLTPSLPAGLIAALPWAAISLSATVLAITGSKLIWAAVPLALAGGLWQVGRSGLLLGSTAVIALELREDQLWAELSNGTRHPTIPAPDSRIGAGITLLKLSIPTAPYSPRTVVLMARGNVQPEPFRQLRVWLRLHGS